MIKSYNLTLTYEDLIQSFQLNFAFSWLQLLLKCDHDVTEFLVSKQAYKNAT